MPVALFQVDSFTTQPFTGNPAGVCVLDFPRTEDWMTAVAREMNLSETAFLVPEGAGYRLRWFTPKVEVSLCGHATLASAHILWEQGYLKPDQKAIFGTRSGILTADRMQDGWIALDFPAREVMGAAPAEGLLSALGIDAPVFVGRYKNTFIVEVLDEAAVREVSPDFNALLKVDARSVGVTARGFGLYDFVSRYFAPAVGINEDPVTGSVHCALTTYWSRKLGRQEMLAYQASARGGELRVRDAGERVILMGQAVTVFTANLIA